MKPELVYHVHLTKNGHWKTVGGRVRPCEYYDLERAREVEKSCLEVPGVTSTMVVRVERAIYSDIATRQEYSTTNYALVTDKAEW